MDKGPVQAAADRHRPVHMDQVGIPCQAIEQILRRSNVVPLHQVRRAVRNGAVPPGHRPAPISPQGGEQGGTPVGAQKDSPLIEHLHLGPDRHAPALPPVKQVREDIPVYEAPLHRGDGAVIQKFVRQVDIGLLWFQNLLHQHRDGPGPGQFGGDIHGPPIGRCPKGGDGLHVPFIGILGLCSPSPHRQGIQRAVPPGIGHGPPLCGKALQTGLPCRFRHVAFPSFRKNSRRAGRRLRATARPWS